MYEKRLKQDRDAGILEAKRAEALRRLEAERKAEKEREEVDRQIEEERRRDREKKEVCL